MLRPYPLPRLASVIAGEATVYIGEVFEWEVTTGSMRRY
jgi:hypothetical protein